MGGTLGANQPTYTQLIADFLKWASLDLLTDPPSSSAGARHLKDALH